MSRYCRQLSLLLQLISRMSPTGIELSLLLPYPHKNNSERVDWNILHSPYTLNPTWLSVYNASVSKSTLVEIPREEFCPFNLCHTRWYCNLQESSLTQINPYTCNMNKINYMCSICRTLTTCISNICTYWYMYKCTSISLTLSTSLVY